jgi:nucleotide-binding universal stress UspA family protein
MPLKNLMVHLDQGDRAAARLALAVSLARTHQARLAGVFAQAGHDAPAGSASAGPDQAYIEAGAASKLMFTRAVAGLSHAQWRDVRHGSETELVRQVTRLARYADMVVVGQHDKRGRFHVPGALVDELILHSGRPVLVLPYAGEFTEVGRHALIAWNDAPEAARALNNALPLIQGGGEATVVCFAANHADGASSCAEVAHHLASHDVRTRTDVLLVEDVGIMDMLLNRVTDCGADLLVMGAHGQIGFPFLSRGAGTRHILAHMTVPVLMSS